MLTVKGFNTIVRIMLLPSLLLISLFSAAQGEKQLIRKGNKNFDKGDFKSAEIDYRKALRTNPRSGTANYNLGTSLYKEKRTEEAAKVLGDVNMAGMDKKSRAMVYHNQGNAFLKAKKYPESIQAYKNALRNSPNDKDTRYNLAYAMKMMQQQQQQQQQKQQNNNQDNKDQKQKQQQQQQQKQEQQQKQQQQQKQEISKSDADRMLEALKNNEKNTLDKLKKKQVKATRGVIEKDW